MPEKVVCYRKEKHIILAKDRKGRNRMAILQTPNNSKILVPISKLKKLKKGGKC